MTPQAALALTGVLAWVFAAICAMRAADSYDALPVILAWAGFLGGIGCFAGAVWWAAYP